MPNFIALSVGENEIILFFVDLPNSLEIVEIDYRFRVNRQIFRPTDGKIDR